MGENNISVNKRTYKCLECNLYDIKIGKTKNSIDRICTKLKNDPRIIVDLDAPNCNHYIFKELN